ncbi:TA system antitoxin ParD family protein [Brevundimonas sp. UBA875]|nr:hypothetical protein [Brevundimonas sp. UBA875]
MGRWHNANGHLEVGLPQAGKLGDDIMKVVRRESELHSRSVARQIVHWVRMGRGIEESGSFGHTRITAALAGTIDTAELTDEEKDVWLDAFVHAGVRSAPGEQRLFDDR